MIYRQKIAGPHQTPSISIGLGIPGILSSWDILQKLEIPTFSSFPKMTSPQRNSDKSVSHPSQIWEDEYLENTSIIFTTQIACFANIPWHFYLILYCGKHLLQ